jgi:Ser/Thr protein kinase RdoA (MazF antagonist)
MADDFYNADTSATRQAAERAVTSWNIDGEPKLLGRLENFTYEAGSNGSERIIRVTETSHRTIAEIEAELDWLRFLSDQGVSVSGPLTSQEGNLVETFDTEDGPMYVSVFTKAPGRPMQFSLDWHPDFHRSLGELIGKMHAATRRYQPSKGRYSQIWCMSRV